MIEASKKAVALSAESPFFLRNLGFAYALSGQKEKAQKILDRLEEISKIKYDSPANKAVIFLGLNEKDQAFEYLRKSYDERSPYIAGMNSPFYDSIREDPRFKELMKKVGFG